MPQSPSAAATAPAPVEDAGRPATDGGPDRVSPGAGPGGAVRARAVPAARRVPGPDLRGVRAGRRQRRRGHQARSRRRPGALPAPRARALGPDRVGRPAAGPGLRLPVPDGPVLPGHARRRTCRPGWRSGAGRPRSCSRPSSGMYRLARALGVRSSWGRLAAAAAYALAPRNISELFSISAELLPVAVAPWVLLPLVTGAAPRLAAPRRGAVRSSRCCSPAASTRPPPWPCCRSRRCGCSPASGVRGARP